MASPAPALVVQDPPVNRLFHLMVHTGASDLHLSVSVPPMIRKDGRMMPIEETAPQLTAEDIRRLLAPITPEKNRAEFISSIKLSGRERIDEVQNVSHRHG